MPRRHATAAAVLTLAVFCACGSSDDDGGAALDTTETGADATGSAEQTDPGELDGQTDEVTVPEVGSVIEGTAVATSAGGDEACQALPDGLLPEGLVEGAPVTIRDGSSGEVIGTGKVASTEFIQHTDQTSESGAPPWTCTFFISATVSSTPESITVQVADLDPFPATLDPDGRFTVTVPSGDTEAPSDGTPPSASTTVVEEGSTASTVAPGDTSAPTDSSFVSPPPET
jgi:hypothetical protein